MPVVVVVVGLGQQALRPAVVALRCSATVTAVLARLLAAFRRRAALLAAPGLAAAARVLRKV